MSCTVLFRLSGRWLGVHGNTTLYIKYVAFGIAMSNICKSELKTIAVTQHDLLLQRFHWFPKDGDASSQKMETHRETFTIVVVPWRRSKRYYHRILCPGPPYHSFFYKHLLPWKYYLLAQVPFCSDGCRTEQSARMLKEIFKSPVRIYCPSCSILVTWQEKEPDDGVRRRLLLLERTSTRSTTSGIVCVAPVADCVRKSKDSRKPPVVPKRPKPSPVQSANVHSNAWRTRWWRVPRSNKTHRSTWGIGWHTIWPRWYLAVPCNYWH